MISIINSLIYNIQLRAKRVHPSLLAYFENTRNIYVGEKVEFDSLSVVKGGIRNEFSVSIGRSTRIRRNCYISATEGIINIGDYVLIAHNAWIAGRGKIDIKNNTLIGPNVVVVSSNHDLSSDSYPLMHAPEIPGIIEIGENCWIGANSTIVPDVRIGDGSIIAAGSVVTSNIPSNSVAAGNPARVIKERMNKTRPYKDVV